MSLIHDHHASLFHEATHMLYCTHIRLPRPPCTSTAPLIFPHSFGDAIKWGISRQSLILFQGLSALETLYTISILISAPRQPFERILYFDCLFFHLYSILFDLTFFATRGHQIIRAHYHKRAQRAANNEIRWAQ